MEEDRHLLTVLKYIERNPVRARLASKAESWRWGSAYRRIHGSLEQRALLAEMPVDMPTSYRTWINTPEPSEDLEAIRYAIAKNEPYGAVTVKDI